MSSATLPPLGGWPLTSLSDAESYPATGGSTVGELDVLSARLLTVGRLSLPTPWADLWWYPVTQRLEELVNRPEGWDHEGAHPVRREVAETAMVLLHKYVSGTDLVPDLVPLVDGGLELTWVGESRELSVGIDAELDVRVWWCDELAHEEWEQSLNATPKGLGHLVYLAAATG